MMECGTMEQTDHSARARARLKGAGARVTATRLAVLEMLLGSPRALSHQEVEQAVRGVGVDIDRVTVYRVLDWLVAHDLAHRIAAEDRVWRFNAADREVSGHAHFQCIRCGQVYCLDDLQPAMTFALPAGYRFQRSELTIQGTCPDCNH
jgi:Fur family ferric uptake transcriptional regulator